MKKVAIVYHYFAHYRAPVIRELMAQKPVDTILNFYSGDDTGPVNLKLMDIKDRRPVKNVWFRGFLWQKGLIKPILLGNYDSVILLGQYSFVSTWLLALLLKLTKTRVYFWGHGVYGNERGLKRIVRKIFNRLPDSHFLYGHHAEALMAGYLPKKRLNVIYNSLDTDEQLRVMPTFNKKSCGDREKPATGIFIGRLNAVKKLDIIPEVVHRAKHEGRPFRFLFVGDGPEKKHLQGLVQRLGVDDLVSFTGSEYDEEKIARLFAKSYFCLSPGNVGLTAMHSLVYGCPVITSDDFYNQMPEFEAVEDGITGSFFPLGDTSILLEKIYYWINKQDGEYLSVSKNCRSVIVNTYNPSNQAHLILDCV